MGKLCPFLNEKCSMKFINKTKTSKMKKKAQMLSKKGRKKDRISSNPLILSACKSMA
jgi:hypothetical protein